MQINDIKNELGTNFIEYAVAVNTDRAIPDAKSGLKPVARRILWSAYDEGYIHSKPHVKCARVVGNVMGKLHPHGDSSIYGALVRLSQDWIMRYPLIEIHGNNGNIAGDGAASMRYTEARLSKLSEVGLLEGLKKKNVDFALTYDELAEEPITLPAIFPNLLCNPNSGIGVAMACNFLPHNLCEVADAIFNYIEGKEPSLPGPDFPTGGIIINKDDIPNIMQTGHGSVKVRGKYKTEKNKIIFYEIPYGTSTENLMNEIGAVCDKKEIEGIEEVRDESNKKGLRLVIVCNKDSNLDAIANKLFLKTNLQTSISYNQVALVNKTPIELNLKDCIKIYLEHNIDCLIKEINFDLKKAKDRLHIVEGLLIALEDIDNVIKLIKNSENSNAAKVNLIEKYKLSEVQAKSILAMRLSSLAKLEKVELEQEQKELIDFIADKQDILLKENRQIEIIKLRLQNLVKTFGDKRRTELTQINIEAKEKEIIAVEPKDCVVVVSESGLIKRIPSKSFKTQNRNGVGIKNNDDIIKYTCKTNTIDTLMIFTSKGKVYKILVDNIPEGTNASKGIHISSLISLDNNEQPMAYASLYRDSQANFVFFVTKNGIIKKVPLEDYGSTKRKTGVIAINLKDGDSLASVTFIKDEQIMLITKKGMAIRFETKEMPISSRTAQGVKGIKLNEEDFVINCVPISHADATLGIFTESGLGKRINLKDFSVQARAGKGVICSKESIAGCCLLKNDDQVLVSGDKTSIRIEAKTIPIIARTGIGVFVLKNNNKVVSISKI